MTNFAKYLYTFLILLLSANFICSQDIRLGNNDTLKFAKYFSMSIGAQISGIKSEDFVSSNISPVFALRLGIWLVPSFGVQVGFKGFFFKYIGDDLNHYYTFLYIDGMLSIENLLLKEEKFKNSDLNLYAGGGLFFNYFEKRTSFCYDMGIQYSTELWERVKLNGDISAIVGWDIYQGNTDILPSISIGTSYLF